MLKNKGGFTLAEILITLTILGVISTLVIPTFYNETMDNEFKVKFKEAYSIMDQVTRLIMKDNAGNMINICPGGCSATSSIKMNSVKDLYKSYLNYIDDCDTDNTRGICFPDPIERLNSSDGTYNGNTTSPGVVLNNGIAVLFYYWDANCVRTFHYDDGGNPDSCGYILFDVNGLRGPNKWGRDVYRVHITKTGLTAEIHAAHDCIYDDSNGVKRYGLGCSQYVLMNRDYDYN